MSADWKNKLYFGDNLDILREHVADESVDLIYLDPPFNSKATYSVLFKEKNGSDSPAQIEAFDDTWHWDMSTEAAYQEVVTGGGKLGVLLDALRRFLGTNDMMAYLTMMAIRLIELQRVLKPTGSIYLHCDPTASHYLKILLDAIFGGGRFQNELIWHYQTGGASKRRFSRKHDVIFWYTKSAGHWTYNGHEIMIPRTEKAMRRAQSPTGARIAADDTQKNPNDVLIIQQMNPMARERLGYPTQKPEALLEVIVKASSNPGDLVLDPFCGCGTTIAVAERLHRRWIGIDITHLAIGLMRHRLEDAFPFDLSLYEVIGDPKDLPSAHALAQQNRFQFEWWALGLVNARPADAQKKGPDKGIDGEIYFFDDNTAIAKRVIVQVKSGNVAVKDIRDLRGVMQREKAQVGAFITLEPPTRPMIEEAAAAGLYKPESLLSAVPCLQILTIEQLLLGHKKLDYPKQRVETFWKAPRQFKGKRQSREMTLEGEE